MFETIILILFIMFILIYKLKYKSPSILIEAFNNQPYVVNDLPDAQNAANVLAKIMLSMDKLVSNIISDFDKFPNKRTKTDNKYINYVRTIKDKLPHVKISENPTNSQYTSYSVNKGEELVFCIRDRKKYKIHDMNELLYVAIHEIAHIGCPEIGHTKLFKKINLYLLKKAICYNIYIYIDYFEENKDYCGMVLTSTIIPEKIDCIIR
jgi:hypothetical protein